MPGQQRTAVVVRGGWDGHQPRQTSDRFAGFLERSGFAVTRSDSLDIYCDAAVMDSVALVVQCWTMGKISKEQFQGVERTVARGAGLAGWHGGLCDSFREHTEWQFMTGGQWVAHPGGCIDYEVHICAVGDLITDGIGDFRVMGSEQYYMHADPSNHVLATTAFGGAHCPHIAGTVMPVVWKRRWKAGRVFYSSLGHVDRDFENPPVTTIMERGLLWASA
jgi:hypothetical protein